MERILVKINDRVSVTIESPDTKEAVRKASFWSELPSVCPTCGAALILTHRAPEAGEYFGMKCLGNPAHETNFGIYKQSERGLYYKREWQLAYQGGSGEEGGQSAGSSEPFRGFPANPLAQGESDQVTSKQLTMIRANAREIGIHSDAECQIMMHCDCGALSKEAASEFIKYLLGIKAGTWVPKSPLGVAEPEAVPTPVAAPAVAPQPVAAPVPTPVVPAPVAAAPAPAPVAPSVVVPTAAPVAQPVAAAVTIGPGGGQIHNGEEHAVGCKCSLCDDIPF